MRIITFMVLLASGIMVSCSTTRDLTANPQRMTDFIVGQTYMLKEPAYLQRGVLARFNDKSLEARYRAARPSWVQAILERGTLLKIRKVQVSRAPEMGTWTNVYGEILIDEQ